MDLRSRRALVTGGAVRIGRAVCERLAESGCDVAVHYRRSGDEAEQLVEALRRRGVRSFAVAGELGSERDCEALLAAAWQKTGGLDILVNNAAVFHKDDLASVTEEKLLGEIRVNLFAPLFLTRAFAARVRGPDRPAGRAVRGKVVNLLDRRIVGQDPACLPYVLSKKMLAAFTRTAAVELAPEITVNGVAPGAVLAPVGEGEEAVREAAGRAPLRHRCTPDDVAQAVRYLLTSDAVTGQIVFVDAGQHLL